ncbi:MAG: GyrI-like domain-containing protein [Chloroflexi bacterium]|nr:GyrI-like domain-containing protein [Chloroflexota bacterium]
MFTEPKVEERQAQPYVGIRTQVRMDEFGTIIPQLLDEIFGWLGEHSIAPAGPPFMRYHVINMESEMDVEMGVPVAAAISANGRVSGGTLPAGKYAALIYTGIENGISGNAALLEWGAKQNLKWDRWEAPNGDGFGARVEFYLTDPDDEPDPARWETEVAIRLADN